MGNSCCSTKGKGERQRNILESMNKRKDVSGRPAHRSRGEIFRQDEIVYKDFRVMAKMACEEEERFIELTRNNKVKDLSLYVGYEMIGEKYLILKSGR